MAIPLEQKRALNLLEQKLSSSDQRTSLLEQRESALAMAEAKESEGDGASKKAIVVVTGLMMLFFAAANDVLDIFVIGQIPILGDILDFIMWGVIWLWVILAGLSRPPAFVFQMFAGIIAELIPVIEFIPSFIAMVLVIILYNLFGKKVLEKLEKAAKAVPI
ncbi:MAG: hypothetical protein A3H02_01645 [Candidatus Niyogibacteria bacterium RIFCSPLOWO2_12_FULL_41_13]|uniref:Uncharacterized protein n=1 Tax=Candidatus Niyogibacteria bacterium RIFCSPLOWO2_12_FULL_41_13 TaxID=1801726 RepID=A0A1G2F277_9BACT|nr:MAG: hypothetical protein A3H02_01645 [Candidatus Niyogibacteria bacterium RIFCSPLOWO2_12_FULL_41_13]